MEFELKTHLITIADIFSAHSKLAPSTIAMRAAGDARFFSRIASGKTFSVKTYDRVIGWYADNWPTDLPWPAEIVRPVPASESPALEPAEAAS